MLNGVRLCLYVIMKELPNAVNLMAPDCGSWGIPARGTTRRAFHNYLGCSYQFVLSGNLMVGRFLDLQVYRFDRILFELQMQFIAFSEPKMSQF